MSILESRISKFLSTTKTDVLPEVNSVGAVLQDFKNGLYKKQINRLREGEESIKKNLPTFAFHGTFSSLRKASHFVEATGLIILDIDDIDPDEDLDEIKIDIMDSCNHIVAVMTSPSGDGIKILYYVSADLVSADNYRSIGKQLVEDFSQYGKVDYLSVTDCLIATFDPTLLINEDAIPAFLMVRAEESSKEFKQLEKRNEDLNLWTDAEDFFDTVLARDIEQKTNNNFHYIQVAIFDLAKFGFKHPQEDLEFVIHYAENTFKKSNDNKKRFLEVVEIAKEYPQTEWPYRYVSDFDDEEAEDEYDFSEYSSSKSKKPTAKKADVDFEEDDEEEDNLGGMIDYDQFFDKVVDVVKQGNRIGSEISLKNFADIFRFHGSGIFTVTGIPSHGKSEYLDQCIIDLARLYGQETLIAGFEQTPQEHIVKLSRKLIGKDITCPTYKLDKNMDTFKKAYDFIISKIQHIDTIKLGGNVNAILKSAAEQIKKSRDAGGNPKYLILDPFNMLSIKGRFSGHEKIEEILRVLTRFSHQMEIMVILVAHPFKMKKDEKTKVYEVPDFYSVKGSSAFFEMSYHGMVIYRTGYNADSPVMVRILKVKQSNLGSTSAEALFLFDRDSTRYIPINEDYEELPGDHRDLDWLEKALKNKQLKK